MISGALGAMRDKFKSKAEDTAGRAREAEKNVRMLKVR